MKYKDLEEEWTRQWFQFILDNLDKPWEWHYLSENPNITWEIIQANPDKDWSWCMLSENPNITLDIIQANLDKPWNWFNLSSNPNISWEFIQSNLDKPWDWDDLSDNSMSKFKNEWINKRRLRHIKAFQIQRHWRNCSCNPQYKLAQRMLLKLLES